MQENTKIQYTKISEQLIKRYYRETDKDWKSSPLSFCKWAHALSGDWSKRTWRVRKSALIYFMVTFGSSEAKDYLTTIKKIDQVTENNSSKKTSQKKSRKISIVDMQMMMDFLQRQCRGKHDTFVAKWLLAGLLVGVRPCEWNGACIDGNSLLVKNAKFSESRSCGEFRRIEFKEDKLHNLTTVFEFVSELTAMELDDEGFEKLYTYCRHRLYLANVKLWPDRKEHICFYTTRHQFSANAKAAMGLICVAALMGHKSTDTATKNYLHKAYGDSDMIFVEACEENMQLVEDKYVPYVPVVKSGVSVGNVSRNEQK